MLSERKGVSWEADTPPFFRYGTYAKREEYTKRALNLKTQTEVLARRTRTACRSFALEDVEDAEALLLAKFLSLIHI